ncbi:hypothetical protein B566_EDAN004299 [Ephemera danica]|nr:hypothetical protein B566_EDAN004299 [Ephemera danica]
MGSKKKGSNKGRNHWKNQIRMEEPLDKALTKDQLKAELKKRGLRTSGSKSELVMLLLTPLMHAVELPPVDAESADGVAQLQRLEQSGNSAGGAGNMVISAPAQNAGPVARKKGEQHSNGNTPPGKRTAAETALRQQERKEREQLVLWRHPINTLYYATLEMLQHLVLVGVGLLLLFAMTLLIKLPGPHQKVVQPVMRQTLWCLYWVGLGVLSSVGLGTGLHTFLLYLGPHIAAVTLAAYECHTLDFPSPPYPDEIVCPEIVSSSSTRIWQSDAPVWEAVLAIVSKVRLEAFMWGAGTALGELPPYFMARAYRLSGLEPDEEEDELRDFEELQRKRLNHESMTLLERAKLVLEQLVEKVGFFGILFCASIPNPLFDLAGITCGHFLVPFWTFFGATLIGKAVFKMHLQMLFVIIAFNESLVETSLQLLSRLPVVGRRLQQPLKDFLQNQKAKLHRKDGAHSPVQETTLLASLFEKIVIAMVLYFVVSIVNSLAQAYHKRMHKRSRESKVATD